MPPFRKSLARSRDQWMMWQDLQKVIDKAPDIPPCTNFPDLFFGDSQGTSALADIGIAKRMCGRCSIRVDCAIYALEATEEFGVWGGLSSLDRKKMKRSYGSYAKAAESLKVRHRRTEKDGVSPNTR